MIYELEKERIMFLIASYLRTRLQKIQKLALYLDRNDQAARLARTHLSEEVRPRSRSA